MMTLKLNLKRCFLGFDGSSLQVVTKVSGGGVLARHPE